MRKLLMPFAFVLAIGAAFAFKPATLTTYYRNNPSPTGSPKCLVETDCTLSTGADCDHTVYTTFPGNNTQPCSGIIDLKKPL
ncbi:DUF6520 family protein [Flavihumibacter fluvii]|uniref:DUF6520 family protein n=1 Tax=Flavihumibacter fluvii TaxID=2838157 RepID=UPI001BDF5F62|nr:DUF6520 family protein [Flavihumibacter fluvii]ULQ52171.1 DUF6520 family protein [Flavihumibacter fluvii]